MKIEKVTIHNKDFGLVELINVETDPDELAHILESLGIVIEAEKKQ